MKLVDMHEFIDRRLSHRQACLEFWLSGRPGRTASPDEAHDIDCMAGIKAVLEAVNNDPRVFQHLKAKGVVE